MEVSLELEKLKIKLWSVKLGLSLAKILSFKSEEKILYFHSKIFA